MFFRDSSGSSRSTEENRLGTRSRKPFQLDDAEILQVGPLKRIRRYGTSSGSKARAVNSCSSCGEKASCLVDRVYSLATPREAARNAQCGAATLIWRNSRWLSEVWECMWMDLLGNRGAEGLCPCNVLCRDAGVGRSIEECLKEICEHQYQECRE